MAGGETAGRYPLCLTTAGINPSLQVRRFQVVKPKRFVSIKATRARFGDMPQSSLYEQIKLGKFPKPYKSGRRNVFSEDELDAHAEQLAKRDGGRASS
jgi:predicted DNA-binding transcriptional regulator AlpA